MSLCFITIMPAGCHSTAIACKGGGCACVRAEGLSLASHCIGTLWLTDTQQLYVHKVAKVTSRGR